jgi:type IV secretory pathway VirB2 component (pilin)
MRDPKIDRYIATQSRNVAIVLAVTMVGWMGAQWLGGRMGWDVRYAFLFDLVALAAFFWALVVTYQIWRKRRG